MNAPYRDEYEWAKALVGNWVLHTGTGLVDKVKRLYTGKDDDVPSKEQNFACIQLDAGDVLVAIEDCFIPITEDERQFYTVAEGVIRHAIKETMTLGAASQKVKYQSACVLLEAALQAQLRAINADNQKRDQLSPVFR